MYIENPPMVPSPDNELVLQWYRKCFQEFAEELEVMSNKISNLSEHQMQTNLLLVDILGELKKSNAPSREDWLDLYEKVS